MGRRSFTAGVFLLAGSVLAACAPGGSTASGGSGGYGPGFDADGVPIPELEIVYPDADADGYSAAVDCNDASPTVHPDAIDTGFSGSGGIIILGDGIDQNCDGIDGVRSSTVYVKARGGIDRADCGTVAVPCRSIDVGIARGALLDAKSMLVAGGTYSRFRLGPIGVHGGFGQYWTKGVTAVAPTTVNVVASADSITGQWSAVSVDGIDSSEGQLADLTLYAGRAGAGTASYGLIVRNSGSADARFALSNLTIVGGYGGAGVDGSNATAWPGGIGDLNGTIGGNSRNQSSDCVSGAGGTAGVNPLANGFEPVSGGVGGRGGFGDCSPYITADNGRVGGAASSGAPGGVGGVYSDCELDRGRGAGKGGSGSNGTNGANGIHAFSGLNGTATLGEITAGSWRPGLVDLGFGNTAFRDRGATGGIGAYGTGGGGGGGGGASDCGADSWGAGGGGGGSGGKGGNAGVGGDPGWASIGVLMVNSNVDFSNVLVRLGTGGRGGIGGSSASGQPGGAGGLGGYPDCPSSASLYGPCSPTSTGGGGGRGGNGGNGGDGGAGGGGAGGPSFGIWANGSSIVGSYATAGGAASPGGTSGTNHGQTVLQSGRPPAQSGVVQAVVNL